MTGADTVRAQLLRRLLEREIDTGGTHALPVTAEGELVPLTPSQARIWFFTQLYPDSVEYSMSDVVHLPVNPGRNLLACAVRTLMERHDALRLRVTSVDGNPVQQVVAAPEPVIAEHDLTHLTPDVAAACAVELATECFHKVVHPDQAPLFRMTLVAMPDGGAQLVVVFHHLITDHWSWMILLRELNALLAGESLPTSGAARYSDYAKWLRDSTDEQRNSAELAYWTEKLGGDLPILDLPADRPRPADPTRRGHWVNLSLPPGVLRRVYELAEREGTTLFVVLLAAYKAMLFRLTGQRDIVVGTGLVGRDEPFTEHIVGCFVKAAALRTAVDPTDSFIRLIKRVHSTVLTAQDHQAVPYEQIVASLDVPRDPGSHPVFQTYFGAQSDKGFDQAVTAPPFSVSDYGAAKWDLSATVTETADGLTGIMECSADLFDRSTLIRFAALFERLVDCYTAEPDQTIQAPHLVAPEERDRILYGLNSYERPQPCYRTLAEPFEEQAARTPGAIALTGPEGDLTYAELNERANRLAHHLRVLGARRGVRIALCLDRGVDMLVAIYAVAKSGSVYVPLDVELPAGRLEYMTRDCAPIAVLTDAEWRHLVPSGPWQVIAVDAQADEWAGQQSDNPHNDPATNHLSHLLYTSGSTGRPKAVACSVDQAVEDILKMQRSYPYGLGDVTIFKTTYGFDTSLWEIFWPLYFGAKLVICPPGGHRDPHLLVDLIERHAVTTIYLIPTLLQVFLDSLPRGALPTLRWVLSGGEPVTPAMRDALYAKLDARLVNGYGPTEVGCATDMVVPDEPDAPIVPLGRPAPNFRLYVLDDDLRVLPVGVPGEVYIAAEVGVSHGYYQRPDLTAESFLPDPFGPPGSRMYRTGDLCRYRADGVLEHLGRIGRQVKVRGMRIELSEVEAVLTEHPAVDAAVAVTAEHNGARSVLAFVVLRPDSTATVTEILDHSALYLPSYMVPSGVAVIDSIPVNLNGKTDHQALLRQWGGGRPGGGRDITPPATELESQLASIFGDVLGLDEVGVTESFFRLGGHSLLIFKLIVRCTRELRIRPQVADVFAAPTVRELARRIGEQAGELEKSLVPIAPATGRPMVVFVHGAGGSALPFVEIGRELGDAFATFALEAPGPAADRIVDSVGRMSARYVDAVDAVRGLSPLIVVGWSFGGCVALEMTREWESRGVSVAATIMLDSWAPPAVLSSPSARAAARSTLRELDIVAVEGLEVADFADAATEFDRFRHVVERNKQMYADYEPQPYAGRVHLLRADAEPASSDSRFWSAYPPGEDNAWGEVVGALSVERVEGNHYTMMRTEHIPELAAVLRRIIGEGLPFGEI